LRETVFAAGERLPLRGAAFVCTNLGWC
jgi:hypothetical protein